MAHPHTPSVLYVANSSKIGGANRVLMDLVTGLNPEHFVPLIVTPGPGPLATWAAEHDIDVCSIPDGDWNGRTGLLRRSLALVLTARTRGVRLVHATAPMCYRAAGLTGRILGVPRVCHLGFPPEPGELAWSFRFGPEAVIACYEGQARDVAATVRELRPACRLVAVRNGIDTRLYRPAPVNWDTHHELRRGASHVVLIIGHLSDVKGYPTFLHAAARIAPRLPDCLFLALGGETTGPGPLERYERLAGELGLRDRVRFLGFRSDVADVIRAADVVVLPSLSEGLPLAILEAMSCAKPVVATPVGGIPEALVHEETGLLVPPNEPEDLAQAVLRVLTDRQLAQRMARNGRRRAETHFSVKRMASEVQALYCELLAGSVHDARRTSAEQTDSTTVLLAPATHTAAIAQMSPAEADAHAAAVKP
jgi:glycosyltransferase involved in cell wall biosynthesis